MNRMIHDLVQGTEAWHRFRLEHHGASEAAAMLGLSKSVTRTELLRAKSTGIAKEFSDFVQTRILDRGHELEALARPHVEALIEDELYPATYSYGKLSASCDGLTMDGTQALEHKQWNDELAAAVSRGEVPEEHLPQCHQVLMVTGAERLIFVVSDGTLDKRTYAVVLPNLDWTARILAGWKQFDEDVATFEHVEVLPPAVADVRLGLPAVSIQVNGQISLIDNLGVFGARLTEFIAAIDRNPSTDQAFADTEAAIKTLEKAQTALEAAEAGALAQTASINEMRRTVAQFVEQARTTRLALEKIVKVRKDTLRIEITQKGKADFAAHVASLNKQIGRDYMPDVPTDFPGVIKGKRTIASLHDAVAGELARAKIAANEAAGRIQINMATLRELASGHAFLFADTPQLVLKPHDDLTTLVRARIVEHNAAETKRLDDERERIRREEVAKIAQEAEAKRLGEDREARERREAEERRQQAERDKIAAAARELEDRERQEREAVEARERQERLDAEARERDERLAREAQEREQREAQEKADREERERVRAETEARAAEEKRARDEEARLEALAREEEEARQREIARKEAELLDGRELLATFKARFGVHPEFAGIVKAIDVFLSGAPSKSRAKRIAAQEFDAQTRVLNAPSGWNKTEPIKCGMLPIRDTKFDGIPAMESFWKPDADEISQLIAGSHIRLVVYGTAHPPVWLDVLRRGDVHIERAPQSPNTEGKKE